MMLEGPKQMARDQGQAKQPVLEISLPAAIPRVADLNMRLDELNSILCSIVGQIGGIASADCVENQDGSATPDLFATSGHLNSLHSELDHSLELLESARRRAESLFGALA